MTAVPRSGWKNTKPAGTRAYPKNFMIFLGFFNDAPANTVSASAYIGLPNCEGWNWPIPNEIHRVEPFVVFPRINVRRKRKITNSKSGMASFFHTENGRRALMYNTTPPIRNAIACDQRDCGETLESTSRDISEKRKRVPSSTSTDCFTSLVYTSICNPHISFVQ